MNMKIKLLSQEIELIEGTAGEWAENGMGRSCYKRGKILLEASLPPTIKNATLLHEIIHLIADMNNLKFADEEETIAILANSFLDFLRRNPQIVARIIKK